MVVPSSDPRKALKVRLFPAIVACAPNGVWHPPPTLLRKSRSAVIAVRVWAWSIDVRHSVMYELSVRVSTAMTP